MNSKGWRVTFDIVTPESSERGEAASSGYVEPGEWHYVPGFESADGMSLREALTICCPRENCGTWFRETDAREDYRTGASETRALHPPRNITPASYARVARLLKVGL